MVMVGMTSVTTVESTCGEKKDNREGITNTSSAVPSCVAQDTPFVPNSLVQEYHNCSTFIAFSRR